MSHLPLDHPLLPLPPRDGPAGLSGPEAAPCAGPPGDRTLTAALGKRILTKDGGKSRPVTVAEPELFLRWLWRHYQNPYFNETKAVDE